MHLLWVTIEFIINIGLNFSKTLNINFWFLALINTFLHEHCYRRLDFDENLNNILDKVVCVTYIYSNREKFFKALRLIK